MSQRHKHGARRWAAIGLFVALTLAVVIGWRAVINQTRADQLTPSEAAAIQAEFAERVAERESESAAAERARREAAKDAALEAMTLRVNRPRGRPLRVLFAGDSLTVGWGATEEADSFRETITRALDATGPVETTLARSTSPGLYRVGNLGEFGADQDLAIVEIGTNDFGRLDGEEFQAAFADMLDKIRRESPQVQFLCLGIWRTVPKQGQDPGYEVIFNDAIAAECEAREGEFVDLDRLIADENVGPSGAPTWIGERDDFHPNDKGHAAISAAVLRQLVVE